jgi:hypothetical protein
MDEHYAAGRDGVFSRPYEPGVLGLPREQQQRLGRLSSDSGAAAGRGLRIKQELDLVPERVKMEPDDSLEYYYAAAGRALPLDSFAFRQQRRHASASPPPPPLSPCLAYPPPPEDGFAAYAAATFRETEVSPATAAAASGSRLEQTSSPQHRLHRVSLTLHLKAEAREEAEREGGGRGEGGRGQRCPPPGQEEEEEEYKDRSEAGSSRTVIGGLLSSICRTTHVAGGSGGGRYQSDSRKSFVEIDLIVPPSTVS